MSEKRLDLIRLRRYCKLSQQDAAGLIGKSIGAIRKWEAGENQGSDMLPGYIATLRQYRKNLRTAKDEA